MRLMIAAVGRLKAGPERVLASDYEARIAASGRRAGITGLRTVELAESQNHAAPARMEEEARALIATLPPRAMTIALDERGITLGSEAFARLIQRLADGGTPDLAFLIGGPDGHAPDIREGASHILAFGPMTWPHRLVRIMLLEQIYRAITIMVNHPYHRA
mgnify:CR=1 FL=1